MANQIINNSEFKYFKFRTVNISDFEAIEEHISKHYIKYEPIHIALGESDSEDAFSYVKLLVKVVLKQNLSFVALEKNTGKISGICLNALYKNGEGLDLPDPPPTLAVAKFFAEVESEYDIYNQHIVDQYGEIIIVSVKPDFWGQGLAHHMLHMSLSVFKILNVPILTSFNTNRFTQRICNRLGFEVVKTWKFQQIKGIKNQDDDGKVELAILKL